MRNVFGISVEEVLFEGHNAMPNQAENTTAQGKSHLFYTRKDGFFLSTYCVGKT